MLCLIVSHEFKSADDKTSGVVKVALRYFCPAKRHVLRIALWLQKGVSDAPFCTAARNCPFKRNPYIAITL